MKTCKVDGCNNDTSYKKGGGKGYCCRHYGQIKQYGKILSRTKYDKNKIINCGNYYEIILYNIKCQKVAKTKIDKEYLDKIKNYKWCLNGCGYVTACYKNKRIYLHQLILGKKQKYQIDHINHNKLDNRKQNLRRCTNQQNSMNKKSKGYYCNKNKKWIAYIGINYKLIYLGYFNNKQQAILARKNAEKLHFGNFAYQNI